MGPVRGEVEGAGVESRTVFVSPALQARLDAYRERGVNRTATSVTFDAIEHCGPELPELVRAARARPAWPADEQAGVRYLGAGRVQIRLCPGAAGAKLLDRLSAELVLSWRTWVPPLLNAYLPGRREPDNMPWLVREELPERAGRGEAGDLGTGSSWMGL